MVVVSLGIRVGFALHSEKCLSGAQYPARSCYPFFLRGCNPNDPRDLPHNLQKSPSYVGCGVHAVGNLFEKSSQLLIGFGNVCL